ncbi:hypothetical protein JW905_16085 [bacterium]|nr:hypothetical protein [candidate division CSSED10-310 bacterium]
MKFALMPVLIIVVVAAGATPAWGRDVPNDVCPGYSIDAFPFSADDSTLAAVNHYDAGLNGCASGYPQSGPDVVYWMTLAEGDQVRVLMFPELTYDCGLYIVTDCGDTVNSCVVGADNNLDGGSEMVELTAPAAGVYYVMCDGYLGDGGGAFSLSVEFILPTPTAVPPSETPTEAPTATVTPTRTLTPTATLSKTPSPTATPSASPTRSPTGTHTRTPTLTPSRTPTTTPTMTATWTATSTPPPTHTPTPPPTEIPSATPSPPATATPAPTGTTPPYPLVIELSLNQDRFAAGEQFILDLAVTSYSGTRELETYVILDITMLGVPDGYYFWPEWSQTLGLMTITYEAGATDTQRILEFTWPEGAGTAAGLMFWSALLEPGTTELASNVANVTFGFR